MNEGTKKKWNNGQRRKSRNPVRDYKFPRCNLALKEFDGTHQSMREAWRVIKLDWIKDYN